MTDCPTDFPENQNIAKEKCFIRNKKYRMLYQK